MTVTHNQETQLKTDPQHQESVFIDRMIGVKVPNGILVKKDGLGLFEGNSVLSPVLSILCLIPFEAYVTHLYNVRIFPRKSSRFFPGERIRARSDAVRAQLKAMGIILEDTKGGTSWKRG